MVLPFPGKKKKSDGPLSPKVLSKYKSVDLDLADTKSPYFKVEKVVVFDLLQVTFWPKDLVLVNKVFLKDKAFFERDHSREMCTHVRSYMSNGSHFFLELLVKKGDSRTFEYYFRDNSGWTLASESKYAQLFSTLVEKYYVLGVRKLNLNLKESNNFFYVNRLTEAPVAVFTAKPGFRVGRVVEGVVDVWERNDDTEFCLNAVVLHKENVPWWCYLLVSELHSEKRHLYFRKDGMSWTRSNKEEYEQVLLSLRLNVYYKPRAATAPNTARSVEPSTSRPNEKSELKEGDSVTQEANSQTLYTVPEPVVTLKVHLDLENPGDKFETQRFDLGTTFKTHYQPKTGYKLVLVTKGVEKVWEGQNEQALYVSWVRYEGRYELLTLCLKGDSRTQRFYFAYQGDHWSAVDRSSFYSLYVMADLPFNSHKSLGLDPKGGRRVLMSSFTNRQGLKVRTYCSPVEDPLGCVVLVHGAYGHFSSDFLSYQEEFFLDYELYKPLVDLKSFSEATYTKMDFFKFVHDNLMRRSDFFNLSQRDGLNLFETDCRYEYSRSFVQGLNNMGYTVYGLDLTSHGLSESPTNLKFYPNYFGEYVNDVVQFLDLLKRRKFYDPKQNYNDFKKSMYFNFSRKTSASAKYKDLARHTSEDLTAMSALPVQNKASGPKHDESELENYLYYDEDDDTYKYYLLGYSMGANVCLRAVNEFYRTTRTKKKLFDGVVCLSGMFQLSQAPNKLLQLLFLFFLSFFNLFLPKSPNLFEETFDSTCTLEAYPRYRDPTYYPRKLRNKTLYMVFNATYSLHKSLRFYPTDLSTLLLSSKEDDLVQSKGSKKLSKRMKNFQYVPLSGNVHGIPLSQYVTAVTPLLNDFFSQPKKLLS